MARLRIISGVFGGRWISADVGRATHPMGDRVRSAMFSMLESRGVLADAEILDAFAGTGAIGLEAISRGAKSATFLEKDRRAANIIDENIRKCCKEANYDYTGLHWCYHSGTFFVEKSVGRSAAKN